MVTKFLAKNGGIASTAVELVEHLHEHFFSRADVTMRSEVDSILIDCTRSKVSSIWLISLGSIKTQGDGPAALILEFRRSKHRWNLKEFSAHKQPSISGTAVVESKHDVRQTNCPSCRASGFDMLVESST